VLLENETVYLLQAAGRDVDIFRKGDAFLKKGTTKTARSRSLAIGMLSLGMLLPVASVPAIDKHLAALANVEAPRSASVLRWTQRIRVDTPPIIERRLSLALAPYDSKTVSHGTPAVREKILQVWRKRDEPRVHVKVLATHVVQRGKPKVVLSGILAYEHYARLAKRKLSGAERFATATFEMLATAYTPNCIGCSGITAIGLPAGHGIVAVDPNVIPLGSRLYVKGYGLALAGDTGGAIHGDRIDLGFNSYSDATEFGRRPVRVYLLR
jgi:3D (Asp-Asp-Asp) domain-containing protein